MVKVFREDLEVSIGEITSSRIHNLEDPHLVIIDEGSSTFGPTWANLFELARRGRFALLFGAQSTGGLTDAAMGLSEAFYERVMANVNLKVMMRIGDNRTASDMTEWFGKITSTKKSVGAGVTTGIQTSLLKGSLDLNSRRTGGESQTVSYQEAEEDLVSAEELKHEMSAEKGLAWFDLGNGKIVKGRSFWFNAHLPETWEGREFIVHPEKFEVDEIGLSDWVDEQILSQEQDETSQNFAPKARSSSEPSTTAPSERKTPASSGGATPPPPTAEATPDGPFKLGAMPRGGRPRGTVMTVTRPPEPPPLSTVKTVTRPGKARSSATGAKTEQGDVPKGGPKPGPFKFKK
jgi:hypothetical protein